MGSSVLHQIQSKMNKITNPEMIQKEERRNPKEGILPPKPNPKIAKEQIFLGLGKWANDGLKNRYLLVQPTALHRNEGFFAEANPRVVFYYVLPSLGRRIAPLR